MKTDHYTYRVTWSAEDGEHAGLCVEFPSLSWLAATPEAALAGIRKMVRDVVRDMKTSGEPIPAHWPRSATAAHSGCASRRTCIVRWPWKQPSKA